jgi:uncharacterized membrane protein (UPF0136 family)
MSHHLAYSCAALCASGGIAGFVRAKSIPSLVAGSAFAILFTASAFLIKNNKDYGYELATVTSAVLAASMAKKAFSGKFIPIGLVGMSMLSGAYYGRKMLEYY